MGFRTFDLPVNGITIHGIVGGSGPALLLLHGYPQTHHIWHKIIRRLAQHFTVVATDLRGYGDSAKPVGEPDHANYSKRSMAADQVAVMQALGHTRFHVCGHDRGARVAHRLALDHAPCVQKLALLDIVPTVDVFERIDQSVSTAYFHWFFLIQGAPLPERLIGSDPEFYLRNQLLRLQRSEGSITPDAFAEYLRCFRDPACIHATCEDYRAAASIDLVHDRTGRALNERVQAQTLVAWGANGVVGRSYDVLALWQARCADVRGLALPCGHYLPEEAPDATFDALRQHFV